MEAPLHQPCGTRHWSSQPCPANKDSRAKATTGKTANATASAVSVPRARPKAGGRVASRPKPGRAEAPAAKSDDPVVWLGPSVDISLGTMPVVTAEQAAEMRRHPGRPRIHDDRKAYKAKKERERRAKLKEGK